MKPRSTVTSDVLVMVGSILITEIMLIIAMIFLRRLLDLEPA
ncbi:MAG: hypothetical protein U0Z44_12845 [Kouleothrix sp.]